MSSEDSYSAQVLSSTHLDLWDFNLETMTFEDFVFLQDLCQDSNSTISSSSNQLISSDHRPMKKKKPNRSQQSIDRWNRIRRANVVPRILKRDIRRNYPVQFINAINSGDESLYIRYFHKYFTPDCLMTISNGKFGEEIFPFRGPTELYKLFTSCIERMPDFSVSLLDSHICIDSKTFESKIVLKVNYSGSILRSPQNCYDLLTQHFHHSQKQPRIGSQQSHSIMEFDEDKRKQRHIALVNTIIEMNIEDELCVHENNNNNLLQTIDTKVYTFPQPVKYTADVNVTFSLNEQFEIIHYDSYIVNALFDLGTC